MVVEVVAKALVPMLPRGNPIRQVCKIRQLRSHAGAWERGF